MEHDPELDLPASPGSSALETAALSERDAALRALERAKQESASSAAALAAAESRIRALEARSEDERAAAARKAEARHAELKAAHATELAAAEQRADRTKRALGNLDRALATKKAECAAAQNEVRNGLEQMKLIRAACSRATEKSAGRLEDISRSQDAMGRKLERVVGRAEHTVAAVTKRCKYLETEKDKLVHGRRLSMNRKLAEFYKVSYSWGWGRGRFVQSADPPPSLGPDGDSLGPTGNDRPQGRARVQPHSSHGAVARSERELLAQGRSRPG